jgi:hypothetical protein
MSPKQVKMTLGWPASHQFDVVGQQVFDAVPVNGVGVSAAHLHELEVVPAARGLVGQVLDGD